MQRSMSPLGLLKGDSWSNLVMTYFSTDLSVSLATVLKHNSSKKLAILDELC